MSIPNQSKSLSDLSQGNIAIPKAAFEIDIILKKNKLSNIFLVEYIKILRQKGIPDKDILDIILIMDRGVESGEFDENFLNALQKK